MTTPATTPLRALALVCSLKPSPAESSTHLIASQVLAALAEHDVSGELVRVVDHDVKPGVDKDMGEGDAWPAIFDKVMAAQALVIGSPIWLGNPSSACIQLLERLYAHSSDTTAAGQYVYYNKVGGCVVTGNDDGGVAAQVEQRLGHDPLPSSSAAC